MRRVLDSDEEKAIYREMDRLDLFRYKFVDTDKVFDRAKYYLERGLVLNVREAVKCGRAYERNTRQQHARRNRGNEHGRVYS